MSADSKNVFGSKFCNNIFNKLFVSVSSNLHNINNTFYLKLTIKLLHMLGMYPLFY